MIDFLMNMSIMLGLIVQLAVYIFLFCVAGLCIFYIVKYLPKMSNEKLSAKWDKLVGSLREQWGHLTDQDLEKVKGKKDQLIGLIKEKYADSKEGAKEKGTLSYSLSSFASDVLEGKEFD